ncbi:MAG: hypothetical protein L6Q97_27410, partial [Thermoanaerobaculia bacterium]|nr:hypothetical protein [Thermoanaerobaculia bacterium]
GMVCETPPPTPPETPPPTPPLTGRGDVTPSTSPLPFRGGVGGGVSEGVGGGVSSFDEIPAVILRHFGHTLIPESAFPSLWELLLQDKKNASGTVRMAVPDAEPFSMCWMELTREEMQQRLRYYNAINSDL